MRNTIKYSIAPQIFHDYPGYVRGVVTARNVENGDSPDDLIALLRHAEDSLRTRIGGGNVAEHPRIANWRDAFRKFGARPSEFRSSIEAMARRVLRNQELPSINRLVDIGNIVSLEYALPAGGHDIGVMTQDISLRPATGNESFIPLGSQENERPESGEIIFAEGNTILTRRWVWRQGNHSAAAPSTQHIEINVDGIPPVQPSKVEEACQRVIELVEKFCGGQSDYQILSDDNPEISLSW